MAEKNIHYITRDELYKEAKKRGVEPVDLADYLFLQTAFRIELLEKKEKGATKEELNELVKKADLILSVGYYIGMAGGTSWFAAPMEELKDAVARQQEMGLEQWIGVYGPGMETSDRLFKHVYGDQWGHG